MYVGWSLCVSWSKLSNEIKGELSWKIFGCSFRIKDNVRVRFGFISKQVFTCEEFALAYWFITIIVVQEIIKEDESKC